MATRKQQRRRLKQAQFHNNTPRVVVGRRTVPVPRASSAPVVERRSAMIVDEPTNDLDSKTRDELREMAAKLNIRGRSIMTKAALINAISTHS